MFIKKIPSFIPAYPDMDEDYFRKMLDFSNENVFDRLKLEKDFLLTLILIKLGSLFPELVFKGGTCLNKIYFPYFRLSEDLDFVIIHTGGRTSRKTLLKNFEKKIIDALSSLEISLESKRKANDYQLGMWTFTYTSVLNSRPQTIKIDVSVKKLLEQKPKVQTIKAIFRNAVTEKPIFGEHTISCIDLQESLAEKIRAALTRKTPAIRDFFDIWYVKNHSDFDFSESNFLQLVDTKLAEVDYDYTTDTQEKYNLLEKQITTDLIPVLHQNYDFSLREIYDFILQFKK